MSPDAQYLNFLPSGAARRGAHHLNGTDVVLDDSVMRRSDALREMMSFARAIVEDGEVSVSEATGFQAWIESNPDVIGLPQVEEIVGILRNVLADGKISDDERDHLGDVLQRFGG